MSTVWRILLVEDDEDDYVLTRGLFGEARQRVELVWERHAGQALERLLGEPFDAVLCDYRLGSASGLDFVRDVSDRGIRVPVILLTGQGNHDVDLAAMAAGVADYLLKAELTADLLDRTIRHAIERRRGEEALRRREETLRIFLERLPAVFWAVDEDLRFTASLGAGLRNLRLAPNEVVGLTLPDYFGATPTGALVVAAHQAALAGRRSSFEVTWAERTFQTHVEPLSNGAGKGVIGVALDVTEARSQERQRKASEERYRQLIEGLQELVYDAEVVPGEPPRWRVVFISSRTMHFLGMTPEEVLADPAEVLACIAPEDRSLLVESPATMLRERRAVTRTYRVRNRRDGVQRWVEDVLLPRFDAAGAVCGFLGVARDITDKRDALEALQRRDAILSGVARVARQLLASGDWREKLPASLAVLGTSAGVSRTYVFRCSYREDGTLLASQRWEWVGAGIEPQLGNPQLEDVPLVETGYGRWAADLASGLPVYGPVAALPVEERALLEQQGIASVAVVPILVGPTLWGFLGFDDCLAPREWSISEVEALRAAADAIAAAIARDRAAQVLRERDEQLRHAQKMDAIGRLAGGIAHDFNNLLTAISGYAELLMLRLAKDEAGREDCLEVLRAAERAASLTRQLLAFSRRQVLAPRPVDLNEVVRETERLLRRLLGEQVQPRTELADGLPQVMADPGQIEQVLMNLAINARDAMPEGGVLTISTAVRRVGSRDDEPQSPLTEGTWVELAVADTGVGIPPEIREQMFEPFFTTKPAGKGTGLGLATVYGIVDQSGGVIVVDSAPGQGARFSVLLPALPGTGRVGPGGHPEDALANEPQHRATVLVVENEDNVLRLVQRVLEPLDFQVMLARTPGEAEALFDQRGCDLLVTDLGLAEGGGVALAARLRARVPNLPLLFMSGYGEETLATHADVPGGAAFLQKPFSAATLVAAVEAALASAVA